jgi:hypothetical protein
MILAPAAAPAGGVREEAAKLEKWTLSHCVAQGYKDSAAVRDAGATQESYFQGAKSTRSPAYEAAHGLALKFLGNDSGKPVLARCLDLYTSKDLKKLVRDAAGH